MATPCNDIVVALRPAGRCDVMATLVGGQAFRWRAVEGAESQAAEGWIGDRPVRVFATDDGVRIRPLDDRSEGLADAAAMYFDAARDYAPIERRLMRDARLRRVAKGVRVLRQRPFETLVGFVVSANNNIPRIGRAVEAICGLAGRPVEVEGRVMRAFPEPAALAALSVDTLRREANLGYRDVYVAATSRLVAEGSVDLVELGRLRTPELVEALGRLPGVGPKVADCVALFAYGRLEVFPVDTWTRRAYSDLYLEGEKYSDRRIAELARLRFGKYAGIAQQYLFEGVRSQSRAAAATR